MSRIHVLNYAEFSIKLQASKGEKTDSITADIPRYSRQIILPAVGLKGMFPTLWTFLNVMFLWLNTR